MSKEKNDHYHLQTCIYNHEQSKKMIIIIYKLIYITMSKEKNDHYHLQTCIYNHEQSKKMIIIIYKLIYITMSKEKNDHYHLQTSTYNTGLYKINNQSLIYKFVYII